MIPPLMPTYNRSKLAFDRGEGCWLIAEDGARYLDFAAGIGVNALGHAHPGLVAALSEQAGRVWHTSNLYRIPQQERLGARLVDATFADTVFFTNSGTEAAELAIKMVRKYWADRDEERPVTLSFAGAFHGRSTGAIAMAGTEKLTAGFGPLMPGFTQLPFGDHDALEAAADARVAAIVVEPVQGEGGIRPLPTPCLRGLRALCDRIGALLIFDEIQCGMGRTGRLFAHESADVAPDIMLVAKGIGGGFPLGAVLATEAAAAPMVVGTHGSTYGGNPLACAVGNAAMDVLGDPDFLDAVGRKGGLLRQRLEGLVATHPDVFESVRGIGLMLGVKCRVPNRDVVAAAQAEGLLTAPGADNVVRLLPPLIVAEEEIAGAAARLDRAATAVARGAPG
jgi:acetylornithine/N-succinyldiaminopimelate aminotransferase